MPIQLTTAKSVGDLDTNDYTHVKVTLYRHDLQNNQIHLTVQHGYMDGGSFVVGERAESQVVVIEGADYGTLMASLPTDGNEKLYDGVARILYQYMIDQAIFVGTIV
jgi:hypothetical protein